MKIDRSNYEAWFLDESEGNLSPEEQQELHSFLLNNPDLEEEFRMMDPLHAIPENISFRPKQALKKKIPPAGTDINRFNFGLFAIAWLENDLEPAQRKIFEELVARDKAMAAELDLYRKAILVPETVVYTSKHKLKKNTAGNIRLVRLTWLAAAAALILALVLFTNRIGNRPELYSVIEEEQPVQPTKETKPARTEPAAINPLTISIRKKEVPPDHKAPVKLVAAADETEPADTGASPVAIPQNDFLAAADFATMRLPENSVRFDMIQPISTPPITSYTRNAPIQLVARKEFEELKVTLSKAEDMSLWDLAKAGISELNKVAGTDMSLMASRDDEGELSGISFSSRRFNLSAPIGRNKD